ncbi:MAG TPA: polysaccharide deacetylase family protein [Candidatus Saccharimonadia bacterium]|nr:polysaccharide deacetylase family protein [Candidatus Saccharimonadia bacterium]
MNPIKLFVRRSIYLTLGMWDTLHAKRKNRVVVLCYHSISNDWRFGVSLEAFTQQMEYLNQNYDFLSLQDLRAFLDGKKKLHRQSVVITFDDGYADIVQVVPLLKKHAVQPTVFLLGDPAKANRAEMDTAKGLLTTAQILLLKKAGWKFGSHSMTHPDFGKLSEKNLQKEVVDSRSKLARELGSEMQYFAYPKGRYSKKILVAVKKAGYALGMSMDDVLIDQNANRLLIPRIGVDATHSFVEFKAIMTDAAITWRKSVKSSKFAKFAV